MSKIQEIGIAASKLSFAAALSLALVAGGKASATTLENLQTAFNGESNANARYLAFAKQAQSEGYGEVASLFRAAARAEKIHATNHAAAIEELGALPKSHIEAPAVKSTRENLEAAIKGETYERDTMYPDFLKQARADRNSQAVRTLNLAKTAEAEHARLYAAALASLEQLKGTKEVSYFVCPVCGFTALEAKFSKCPSCFTPKEAFERVA
jgi:rubrerythrin